MTLFLSALIGFFISCLDVTFFGSFAFLALAASYAYALYLLFFSPASRPPTLFLIGLTLGTELLGTAHFGLASFLAVFLYCLYYIFQQRLRFTSLFARYIVALLLSLLGYSLLLFPLSSLVDRLWYLLFAYPIFIMVSYTAFGFRPNKDYEFI